MSTYTVGVDHIDVALCTEREIKVGHTPYICTDVTADLTIALLLMVSRRIPEAAQAVKSGKWGAWSPTWQLGTDIAGATAGIIGFGRMG